MGERDVTVDGRTLRVAEWGTPTGIPVLYLHGTPGSRLSRSPAGHALAGMGVRLLTYDRAGYGGSDRRQGRSVADVATDVAGLAAALGIDRLPVLGYSGGGPHALACAALLPGLVPGLVPAAAALSSVAPHDAAGLDWLAGMTELNVAEFDAAVRGRDRLEAVLGPAAARIVAEPESFTADLVAELPAVDAEALRDPEVGAGLTDAIVAGLRPGGAGWVDDDLAFVRPWGFDLGAIGVPTALWHGTEDVLAPCSHAVWLARAIPGARLHQVAGTGHLGMLAHHADAIGWLLAQTGGPAR